MNLRHGQEIALVKKSEAAEALGVSIRTVERYVAEGSLHAVKLSPRATRITRSSLEDLAGRVA